MPATKSPASRETDGAASHSDRTRKEAVTAHRSNEAKAIWFRRLLPCLQPSYSTIIAICWSQGDVCLPF